VNSSIRVASPPAKPLVLYDGDCGFCKFWIHRWRGLTVGSVEYLTSQEALASERFPEIPREQLDQAVQLIMPDGRVLAGAEAVFQVLAFAPHRDWLLHLHQAFPLFADTTESAYRFVARNRMLFSLLTRLAWGANSEPSTYALTRNVFLRSLGVVYFVAFISLWVQIMGLCGSRGILPARTTMQEVRIYCADNHIGVDRYRLFPTLCWLSASDTSLKFQCAAGFALAVLLVLGIAPVPALFLLWLAYLSLATVCQDFLSYQWDALLLEVGFVAIFYAPLQCLPRRCRAAPQPKAMLFLLRCILLLLMLESGLAKLAGGDPLWRHFTALTVHYETQPLPTWIGWYAHQLPVAAQKFCVAAMFFIELILPFCMFLPRRLRHFAATSLILLQVVILLTGNYGFFNYLTIVLCLLLYDDAALRAFDTTLRPWRARNAPPQSTVKPKIASSEHSIATPCWRWPAQITVPLTIFVLGISLVELGNIVGAPLIWWPKPIPAICNWVSPFRSINRYGLFPSMTTPRMEIVIEGSEDGEHWTAYEFKYKPGDPGRRPGFVAPYQPRLDWQMWFAALSGYQHELWFERCCFQLLQGSPDVIALLEYNPFPESPPHYLRAEYFEYHFTNFAQRRQTGAWWTRELKGLYLPPISLHEQRERPFPEKILH
jgi:predicted DCC family thiol-disulfide oxidoreductase YuxK